MKLFSLTLFTTLIPFLLLGQIQGTFTIKKPEPIEVPAYSIKHFYPDSLEITPLRVLGFNVAIESPQRDPMIRNVVGEIVPEQFFFNSNWYPVEGDGGRITFFDIVVQRPDKEIDTLQNFYTKGALKRAKFPIYRSLKELYPNPHINRNVARFLSYQVTAIGKAVSYTHLTLPTIYSV